MHNKSVNLNIFTLVSTGHILQARDYQATISTRKSKRIPTLIFIRIGRQKRCAILDKNFNVTPKSFGMDYDLSDSEAPPESIPTYQELQYRSSQTTVNGRL